MEQAGFTADFTDSKNYGAQISHNSGTITNNFTSNELTHTNYVDRSCLRALRCPDTLLVKNRLKENKDKLLYESMEWILRDGKYLQWRDGDDVSLLWIKGGAGKGKTMMSIGLIERLSHPQSDSTVVTYFFCQNADYKLNTIAAIIKGLILQLVNQRAELKESLRCRWDPVNNRFDEDVSSWRTLWNIFSEMLTRCKCQRVYIIVDALDECEDNGMADFFRSIVRTGLYHPSKIKWLLISRPLDSAEQEFFVGHDQEQVSLELNSEQIFEAVRIYITFKVAELDHRQRYGETLRHKIESLLTKKAEGTYLWVSLVCKRLENVHRDETLSTIQKLPQGLHPFYDRIFHQLCKGESSVVERCMRLLKVMLLAYRPLNVREVGSVTGLSDSDAAIKAIVDRCASFINIQGSNIEFVHQSVQDYFSGKNAQYILNSYEHYDHSEIALSCLSSLSKQLKANLIALPWPCSSMESFRSSKAKETSAQLVNVDYAATFWVQHLGETKQTIVVQNALSEQGTISKFLHTKFLEWLECLSLLDKSSHAIDTLKVLTSIVRSTKNQLLSNLVQDASRFLLRHYHILVNWPLQIYSSAIIFSPETSMIKKNNLDKAPPWLKMIPRMEDNWASVIQTLASHSDSVNAVAFSPDGKLIASGSWDNTIKLWDTTTGDVQQTLAGHSSRVNAVTFSPDGKLIASGSADNTIKLWDTTTGDVQKNLAGHSSWVNAVTFSPDGKLIASGSWDNTIKLWDTTTGNVQKTLAGHSSWVNAVAFSPDGKLIASGSWDKTIKLWDTTTGDVQKTLAGHSSWVNAVAFSPDGKLIASGSEDKTIKLWDVYKCLKASKLLGATINRYMKFRSYQDINTSEPVYFLKFSSGQSLATNIGPIRVENIPSEEQGACLLIEELYVRDQWVYYGKIPVLRLPPDFQSHCYNTQGDRLAIGFSNGQTLSFNIDRSSLQFILKCNPRHC